MAYYAYERVSTDKQDHERQTEGIKKWADSNGIIIDRFFTDTYTRTKFDRESLSELKSIVQSGDHIVVWELDRLGGDWDGIKNEMRWFTDNNIIMHILDLEVLNSGLQNTDPLTAKLIQSITTDLFCYVASKEVLKIRQRTKEALQAKKAQGVVLGKPRNEERYKALKSLYNKGVTSPTVLAQKLGIDRKNIYRMIHNLEAEGQIKRAQA